jgi:short-subunit dehydrogenase
MALPDPAPKSTALVTGASSGIGEAIARELAGRGHNVTLVARREDRLQALAEELGNAHGVGAQTIGADLEDPAARDAMANRIEELGVDVDILVNNAGFGHSGDFANRDRRRLLAMVRVNCEALVDLQARYLPPMIERGRGTVINIASTAAFQPMPGSATYSATKHFVLSLSEGVHEELSGTGVSLTAVCPGPVRTEFMDVSGIGGAEDNTPDMIWMTPEAVAEAAVSGAERGKRVVVPGLMNRAGAITGQHAPRAIALPLVRRLYRRST